MSTKATRRPGRALDTAKRAAILEGARAVFMREGFAQGTMDGVANSDSIHLYRAIVAEAGRMPGLGHLFWEAGPRPLRAAIAQLLAEERDTATAQIVAQQIVNLTLGDAYQELVLGTGSPGPEVFERQIDAALALLGLAT